MFWYCWLRRGRLRSCASRWVLTNLPKSAQPRFLLLPRDWTRVVSETSGSRQDLPSRIIPPLDRHSHPHRPLIAQPAPPQTQSSFRRPA